MKMKRERRKEEVDRELTTAGAVLCAVLGAAAEGMIFWGLGLRVENIPLFVAAFLWGLFGIIVSGILILTDQLHEFFIEAERSSENAFLQEARETVCVREGVVCPGDIFLAQTEAERRAVTVDCEWPLYQGVRKHTRVTAARSIFSDKHSLRYSLEEKGQEEIAAYGQQKAS